MNNILTAKEWLEKEDLIWNYTATPSILLKKPELEVLLKRYANYRTKMLESKILGFRHKVKDFQFLSIYDEDKLLYKFDEHFGIEGKIN